MLKNFTVKQHLDHAIKQWEFVRDTGQSKLAYLKTNNLEEPFAECFLCEIYLSGTSTTILKVYPHCFHCKQCPLAPNGKYCECEYDGEPYKLYGDEKISSFEAGSEIVEILKAHKKKINL